MTNKIDLIRQIIDLSEEGIFDSREVIEKIKIVLNKHLDETELPEILVKKEKISKKPLRWQRFSKRENNFISKNYLTMKQTEIAEKIGRSKHSVRQRIKRLIREGVITHKKRSPLTTEKRKYNKFTAKETAFIKNNYEKMSSGKIAKILGRAQSSIWDKVQQLKT